MNNKQGGKEVRSIERQSPDFDSGHRNNVPIEIVPVPEAPRTSIQGLIPAEGRPLSLIHDHLVTWLHQPTPISMQISRSRRCAIYPIVRCILQLHAVIVNLPLPGDRDGGGGDGASARLRPTLWKFKLCVLCALQRKTLLLELIAVFIGFPYHVYGLWPRLLFLCTSGFWENPSLLLSSLFALLSKLMYVS